MSEIIPFSSRASGVLSPSYTTQIRMVPSNLLYVGTNRDFLLDIFKTINVSLTHRTLSS